jgi:hypothetical protein
MLNGRHLLLLGGLAVAGLLSVREGERQTVTCYQIATLENEIRDVKADVKLARNEHLALQSPKAVKDHATQLRLPLAPVPAGMQTVPPPAAPNTRAPNRAPTAPAAPPAPVVPTLPQSSPER